VEAPTDPRAWIAVCAVVGLIAAGAGVGGTLLFVDRGPTGPAGKVGAVGPPGPSGTADLQATADDLDKQPDFKSLRIERGRLLGN
jgi:hypothetical protein